MKAGERRRIANIWYAAAVVTFLAVAIYLVVLLLPGFENLGGRDRLLAVLIGTVVVGAGAVLAGWRLDRERLSALVGAEDDTRRRLEAEVQHRDEALARAREEHAAAIAERDRRHDEESRELEKRQAETLHHSDEEHGKELAEREHSLGSERRLRSRLIRARQAEQEWNRELRGQVFRMHAERGALGDVGDLRGLVVRLSVTLLEAEKGLLLSREDRDGDNQLDLVASVGFDRDPRHSALAQRFAKEVLEHDKTVREDSGKQLQEAAETKADEEIRNLVAIPIYIRDQFSGVVVCANRDGGFDEFDDEVLVSLGDHAGAVLENGRLHGELRGSYLATVTMLADAIQAKDPFLRGHSDEVSGYVAAVADRLGLDPKSREELVFASLLHDVGKIGISERILLKPAKLTPEEYSVVQLHPRIGYRLVQKVPALRPISSAILHHHERFDGDGYPGRLRGEDIPLEARVICVADSFSAMTAERPYRGRMSLEEACEELERCAGTQFDPEVVRIFVEEVRRRPLDARDVVESALADPELEVRRDGDEPILGHGSLAVIDNLTLLYTHRYFHEVAGSEAQRASLQDRPFSILLVELTDIGEINGRDGYAAGDTAIRMAASAIQRAAVRCGGTAARYGGRCLGLIAPNTDDAAGEGLAGELAGDLREGSVASVSSATWRRGETGDEVIARARGAFDITQESPAPPVASPRSPQDASPTTGAGAVASS